MALNYEQELEIHWLEWSLSPATSGGHIEKARDGIGLVQSHNWLAADRGQNQGLQGPGCSRPGGRMKPATYFG